MDLAPEFVEVSVVSRGTMPASSCPPCKEWAFNVSVPTGSSIDSVIDSVVDFVGLDDIDTVQHLGFSKFQVVVKSASASRRVVQQGFMKIGNQQVQIEPIGPVFTMVVCRYLPAYVSSDHLIRALQPYGKVLEVEHVMYKDRPTIKTGDRAIHMEMKEDNPVPNFLRVHGHRVTFSYKGMKRVCRRCRQEGHYKDSCTTPYCERCLLFGHATELCSVPCRRCGGSHATVDCTVRKSYSEAAGRSLAEYPALPSKLEEPAMVDVVTAEGVDEGIPMTTELANKAATDGAVSDETSPLVIVEDGVSENSHGDDVTEVMPLVGSQRLISSSGSSSTAEAVHPLPHRLATQAPGRDTASSRRESRSPPTTTDSSQDDDIARSEAKRQLSTSSGSASESVASPRTKRTKVIPVSSDILLSHGSGSDTFSE